MRYEATLTRLMLAGVPLPAEGALPTEPREDDQVTMPEPLAIRGVATLPATVDQAQREADELLRRCKARIATGERSAIIELLDINLGFIGDAWVRETYIRLHEEGGPRRKRGRPIGRDKVNPLIIIGLVGHLIDTNRAKNREQAFGKLEELGLMTYAAAKDSFYRGLRDQRFKPILLEFPDLTRQLTEDEAAALVRRVEILEPGRTIRRRVDDPQLGTVEIEFTGF